MTYNRREGRISLELEIIRVGKDINAVFSGGDAPHIGSAVLAVPRASLADDKTTSSTSSVINVPSHKDELICRECAERISSALQCVCVCTGGFHCDGLSEEEIGRVLELARELTEEAVRDGLR
ncbi:MAG: hypothetical protein IKG70_09435 [Lachnospiraceae bacterium]|nr:hypothetical protein [Lachnospiraceae bacterium]